MTFARITKGYLKKRLETERRWGEYISYRTFLHQSGVGRDVAWKVAALAFPPLDGSEPEVLQDSGYAEVAAKFSRGEYPPPPVLPRYPSGMVNFDAPIEATEEHERLVEDVKQAPKKYNQGWDDLLSRVPLGRKSKPLESVQWLYEMAGSKPEEIDPESVPSRGDAHFLKMMANGQFAQDFYTKIWSRTIPDKRSLEEAARFNDDGRTLRLMMDTYGNSLEDEEPDAVTEGQDA